jgi:hypothetical protein
MSSQTADDMDVYVIFKELYASGEQLLSLNIPLMNIPPKSISEISSDKRTEIILYTGAVGMLRASHRQIDSSKLMHQNWPYHPYEQEDKVKPGEIVTLEIGIWATGMVFEAGETLELRISGFYPGIANFGTNEYSLNVGQHTVHFGGNLQRHSSRPTARL